MALIRERDGKRLHVKSKLMGESLVSQSFAGEYDVAPQQRLFPDVHVLKIGGQSICDLGKRALPAVVAEIAADKKKHKMFLLTGGGTRSRHIYAIGLDRDAHRDHRQVRQLHLRTERPVGGHSAFARAASRSVTTRS